MYRKAVHSGRDVIELTLRDNLDANACYVVNASWIVQQPQTAAGENTKNDQVSASWAWHRCKN